MKYHLGLMGGLASFDVRFFSRFSENLNPLGMLIAAGQDWSQLEGGEGLGDLSVSPPKLLSTSCGAVPFSLNERHALASGPLLPLYMAAPASSTLHR